MKRSTYLLLSVFVALVLFQARGALAQTVEPDDYADHQNISTAVPGITLSTIGDVFDSSVYAVDDSSDASTGTKVFGFKTDASTWGTRWDQEGFTLQATFATPMGSVSLDFVLGAASGNGQLLAFNAANVQIDAAMTPSGNSATLTVSSAAHDISYVRASFTNVQAADAAGLDHLVVMIPEPSVLGLLSAGLLSSAILFRKRIRGK